VRRESERTRNQRRKENLIGFARGIKKNGGRRDVRDGFGKVFGLVAVATAIPSSCLASSTSSDNNAAHWFILRSLLLKLL
jgi:hypothetical protein